MSQKETARRSILPFSRSPRARVTVEPVTTTAAVAAAIAAQGVEPVDAKAQEPEPTLEPMPAVIVNGVEVTDDKDDTQKLAVEKARQDAEEDAMWDAMYGGHLGGVAGFRQPEPQPVVKGAVLRNAKGQITPHPTWCNIANCNINHYPPATKPYSPPPPPAPRATTADRVKSMGHQVTGFPRIDQADLLKDESIQQLLSMLGYMRPHKSTSEEQFIQKFLAPLNGKVDKYGNRWVRVLGPTGAQPDILFSCHTDTVHTKAGMQKICVGDGRAFAEDSECLGADDGAGVWLMIQMIKAKVPGLYIFHRDEEHGGHGSAHIVKTQDKKLKSIRAAIAFDRKGYGDVITRQRGGECCSFQFAASLAAILGGQFKGDPTGTFTDTANYTHLIPECTNVSVGYHNAHGPMEWLELSFILGLRDALILADWSKLVIYRKPSAQKVYEWDNSYGYGGTRNSYRSPAHAGPSGGHHVVGTHSKAAKKTTQRERRLGNIGSTPWKDQARFAAAYGERARRLATNNLEDLLMLCHLYPDTVAHFLAEKRFTVEDVTDFYNDTKIITAPHWDEDVEDEDGENVQ